MNVPKGYSSLSTGSGSSSLPKGYFIDTSKSKRKDFTSLIVIFLVVCVAALGIIMVYPNFQKSEDRDGGESSAVVGKDEDKKTSEKGTSLPEVERPPPVRSSTRETSTAATTSTHKRTTQRHGSTARKRLAMARTTTRRSNKRSPTRRHTTLKSLRKAKSLKTTLKTTTRKSTLKSATRKPTLKSATGTSTLRPATTNPTLRSATGTSTLSSDTTNSTLRPATGTSTLNPDTTNTTLRPATGTSIMKSATRNLTIKSATRNSTLRSATRNSTLKSATRNTTLKLLKSHKGRTRAGAATKAPLKKDRARKPASDSRKQLLYSGKNGASPNMSSTEAPGLSGASPSKINIRVITPIPLISANMVSAVNEQSNFTQAVPTPEEDMKSTTVDVLHQETDTSEEKARKLISVASEGSTLSETKTPSLTNATEDPKGKLAAASGTRRNITRDAPEDFTVTAQNKGDATGKLQDPLPGGRMADDTVGNLSSDASVNTRRAQPNDGLSSPASKTVLEQVTSTSNASGPLNTVNDSAVSEKNTAPSFDQPGDVGIYARLAGTRRSAGLTHVDNKVRGPIQGVHQSKSPADVDDYQFAPLVRSPVRVIRKDADDVQDNFVQLGHSH